jgi:uncharacterized protein with von Willebrand factor type A (vWA) domain
MGSDFYKSLPKQTPIHSDHVLKSLRIDDEIYKEARMPVDDLLSHIELESMDRLPIIESLTRDVFQSFYSLIPRFWPEEELSPFARKISRRILGELIHSEDYALIKSICEGKPYPAMEATTEFMDRIAEQLDSLMDSVNGKNNAMNTLDKQEKAQDIRLDELKRMENQRRNTLTPDPVLEKKMLQTANRAAGKVRQLGAIGKIVDNNLQKNKELVSSVVSDAARAAMNLADEAQSILLCWGTDTGEPEYLQENRELVRRVRENNMLCQIARYLGRLKEMLRDKRKNSFAFGRGEKYSLELGNDMKSVITSEFSMLASPATIPLFLRKHAKKGLKQYKRRERVYKGSGDIICCLDESSSTMGDNAAWGKAVALALQDVAQYDKRKFALIHFSSYSELRTDLFRPGQYTPADLIASASHFFNGGTNFETPMREAVRLMEQENFSKADIVFITDGECHMPEDFINQLKQKQADLSFTITGVLMDQDSPGMAFSLKPFCNEIYRVSELDGNKVAEALLSNRT